MELQTIASTTGVLAATTYFHDVRFLGFLAVFAAVFAVLLRRTIASGVRTFRGIFFSHESTSLLMLRSKLLGGIVKLC